MGMWGCNRLPLTVCPTQLPAIIRWVGLLWGIKMLTLLGLVPTPKSKPAALRPAPKTAAPRGWAMAALLTKMVGLHGPPKWGFGPPALAHGMPLAWPRAMGEKTRAMRQMHAPQGNAPMAGALAP